MSEDTRTISFVAREELADWIEQEADDRMTTVSSAAQQLLAEKYQEATSGRSERRSDDEEDPLERFSEHWYDPDSHAHDYAVRVPQDADVAKAGGQRYYKTADGARKALQQWYA